RSAGDGLFVSLSRVARHGSMAAGARWRRLARSRAQHAPGTAADDRIRRRRHRDVPLDHGRETMGRRAADARTADPYHAAPVLAVVRRTERDPRAGPAPRSAIRGGAG